MVPAVTSSLQSPNRGKVLNIRAHHEFQLLNSDAAFTVSITINYTACRAKSEVFTGSFTKVLDVCRFLRYFIQLIWCLTHSLRSVAATPAPTSCSKKGLNWKKAKNKIHTRLRSYGFPLENTGLHTLDKEVWILSLSWPGPGISTPTFVTRVKPKQNQPTLLLPS